MVFLLNNIIASVSISTPTLAPSHSFDASNFNLWIDYSRRVIMLSSDHVFAKYIVEKHFLTGIHTRKYKS